jgi:hypothetical protein
VDHVLDRFTEWLQDLIAEHPANLDADQNIIRDVLATRLLALARKWQTEAGMDATEVASRMIDYLYGLSRACQERATNLEVKSGPAPGESAQEFYIRLTHLSKEQAEAGRLIRLRRDSYAQLAHAAWRLAGYFNACATPLSEQVDAGVKLLNDRCPGWEYQLRRVWCRAGIDPWIQIFRVPQCRPVADEMYQRIKVRLGVPADPDQAALWVLGHGFEVLEENATWEELGRLWWKRAAELRRSQESEPLPYWRAPLSIIHRDLDVHMASGTDGPEPPDNTRYLTTTAVIEVASDDIRILEGDVIEVEDSGAWLVVEVVYHGTEELFAHVALYQPCP